MGRIVISENVSLDGVVEDVAYLGPFTRYEVAADAGGRVVVLAQNQGTGASEASALHGRRVRVAWARAHTRRVEAGDRRGEAGEGTGA